MDEQTYKTRAYRAGERWAQRGKSLALLRREAERRYKGKDDTNPSRAHDFVDGAINQREMDALEAGDHVALAEVYCYLGTICTDW